MNPQKKGWLYVFFCVLFFACVCGCFIICENYTVNCIYESVTSSFTSNPPFTV
ncbi:hypothetical protein Lalb_Chr17g0338941 [Lupinus albus]|uniref:Uncharacterized protein n=1 Tax=Lupinus albus TaxID=3870 RepID=A0A6A4P1I0_LUPAL|nr:hypothetical protein Lalb_Chr17g0338941 [Lupinus albus]